MKRHSTPRSTGRQPHYRAAVAGDEDALEEYRHGLRDSLEWFSNSKKREREVQVCDKFLQNLGVAFSPTELIPVDDQAPDVLFREVRFEVKEWLDQGRRRTDEYREKLRQAEQASSTEELWEYLPTADLTLEMIVSDIEGRISGWAAQYEPRFRGSLDLLVYHNRVGFFFKKSPVIPPTDIFSSYGFRSVSMTTNSRAWVLWAGPLAPSLIASIAGSILKRQAR